MLALHFPIVFVQLGRNSVSCSNNAATAFIAHRHCTGFNWTDTGIAGVELTKVEAATYDCALIDEDLFTNATLSPGLCVLVASSLTETFIGGFYDVQEQDCEACAQQVRG